MLMTIRDSLLRTLASRLAAIDLTTATDSQALLAGAMLKQIDAVNRLDLASIDGLSLLQQLSAADLDAYATDPAGRLQLQAIFADIGTRAALLRHAPTMAALAASADCVRLMQDAAGLPAELAASQTAMNALAASSSARAVIMTAGALQTAVINSDMATAKLLAGVQPTSVPGISTIDHVITHATLPDSIAGSAQLRQLLINQRVAPTVRQYLASDAASAKVLAGIIGTPPASVGSAAVLISDAARRALLAKSVDALKLLADVPGVVDRLMMSLDMRRAFWDSPDATLSLLATSSVSRGRLPTSTVTDYQWGSNPYIPGRAWLLDVYVYGGTSGGVTTPARIMTEVNGANVMKELGVVGPTAYQTFQVQSWDARCLPFSPYWIDSSSSSNAYATYRFVLME